MDIFKQLLCIRRGGEVRRFHTHRRIKEENVAEHSFGVAWILWLITEGQCSAALLMEALVHDLAEQETGDIPAPFKHRIGFRDLICDFEENILRAYGLPVSAPISEIEKWTLKLADSLDALASCCREAEMGNKLLDDVFCSVSNSIGKLVDKVPEDYGPHSGAAIASRATALHNKIAHTWEST